MAQVSQARPDFSSRQPTRRVGSIPPLSSEAWRAYDTAVERFLAAAPGSLAFEVNLALMTASELALERADMLEAGELADAEVISILESIAGVLRGRVRSVLLVGALAAVEDVLASPKFEAE